MNIRLMILVGILMMHGVLSGTGKCAPPEGTSTSPRQAQKVFRNLVLTEDTFWSGDIKVEGGVTVAPQATLTVAAGTTVNFAVTGEGRNISLPALLVQGRLAVNGTPEQPVIFTGIGPVPDNSTVSWQGILLVGSEKNNILSHTRIKGAKVGIDTLFSRLNLKSVWADRCGIGIRAQDVLIELQGGVVSGCGTGLQLYDTEAALRGTQVKGNRLGIQSQRGSLLLQEIECSENEFDGLQATGSRLSLDGNRFIRNGNGMSIEGSEGIVRRNRIIEQRRHGVVLSNARIRFRDNLVTGNAGSGIVVKDGRGVAIANALHGNGQFDLQNDGQDEFRAPGNWWGGGDPRENNRMGGNGPVVLHPLLPQAPPEL